MEAIVSKIENWLRISRFDNASDMLRARAVYGIGFAFIFMQCINLVAMIKVYGGWTLDHNLVCVAIIIVLANVVLIRFKQAFTFTAICLMTLSVVGIAASASVDYTGISSAVLPMLPATIFIAGIISDWRLSIACGLVGLVLTALLYNVSIGAPAGAKYDPAIYGENLTARAIQISLATILASIITARISHNLHHILSQLETSLDKVRRAERAKTEFLANLSHELRTPLNGVIGMSGLLLRTRLDSQQNQYAKIVNDCGKSLTSIVEDVLEISKLDSSRFELKPTIFSIRELSNALVMLHHPATAEKGLALKLHITKSVPESFYADEGRIRQVINNLLSNAVKFTKNGAVHLYVDGHLAGHDNYQLKIYVQDTGIGINKEDQLNVFKRFHRIDNSLSTEVDGTGLGLAICKEYIEAMGGSLNVISEEGVGSTFYFDLTLPIAVSDLTGEENTILKPIIPVTLNNIRTEIKKAVTG